ncbi:MAG: strawberry notch family protein [Rhodospirillales bacterium]|nr:strawberry notch family protein [Rhodospirillales bacterium]
MSLSSLPLFSGGDHAPIRPQSPADRADRILEVADDLLAPLTHSHVDTGQLREFLESAFGGSDAAGAWTWKDAWDALEAAQVLHIKQIGPSLCGHSAPATLRRLEAIAARVPTHSHRSEQQLRRQQFSTPLPLAWILATAADPQPGDVVLEPSAGTGLLAVFARIRGATLILNELDDLRAALLRRLFRPTPVGQGNAEQIHDLLDPSLVPSIVLINPPFTVGAHRACDRHAAHAHLRSALLRLAPGGRMVALTAASFQPDTGDLAELASPSLTISLPGDVYRRHGTTVETRLTVYDKPVAGTPASSPRRQAASSLASALEMILQHLPARPGDRLVPPQATPSARTVINARPRRIRVAAARLEETVPAAAAAIAEIGYHPIDRADESASGDGPSGDSAAPRMSDALYQAYAPQRICIPGAADHPTPLVQSVALASVLPPLPHYRPRLYAGLLESGALSAAQIESVIYAGEAHGDYLAGAGLPGETFDAVVAVDEGTPGAVRYRRGWFLGDGTGAGKGRQVAGILLDNWLHGRRRALWLSFSSRLVHDARRDWTALGGDARDIADLSRWSQDTAIPLSQGILFLTYATLRVGERKTKPSRLQQVLDWLGTGFDGVIVFDEAHAMANAAGGKTVRGDAKPSEQGRAGLRLQNALPEARVVYVSATGATELKHLAYASRLGLWGTPEIPFATRNEFIAAIEQGGVAAMEMVCRDLKAQGLYASRSLSFDGVEYDIIEHPLTPAQTEIYDAFAVAFTIIHTNLGAALDRTHITDPRDGTLDRNAKAAALSAFESAKQRFFAHLLVAMKCPTLIRAIEHDLACGHAAIVQLVSTGEALMDRRLAEIPPGEQHDLQLDQTPREIVMQYLANSFPTQLHEIREDESGNPFSVPLFTEDGAIVHCRESLDARDRLIEQLGALPAVGGALDQLVQHFGSEQVAEITGRSRRVVRKHAFGRDRLCVEKRPAGAALAETQAFMEDRKRILLFSNAGGVGRSYHADLGCRNQRRRMHYLLEAGWRADQAIQGLGRSHRTNQAATPVFKPVTTDVKGERRFTSTIARRLDSLGALTRGQRQTGGQGLFRPEDNLESSYARAALRLFFRALHAGSLACCTLRTFCEATGLTLTDKDGSLLDQLPPIHQFLNRILALRIATQNAIFDEFEQMIAGRVEQEIAAGTYEAGIETIRAESLTVADRQVIHTDPRSGARTHAVRIRRVVRNQPLNAGDALGLYAHLDPRPAINTNSRHAGLVCRATSIIDDDGAVIRRVRINRPLGGQTMTIDEFERSHWRLEAAERGWHAVWAADAERLPATTEDELVLVTGLLLPIWTRLPDERMLVYRLQTDDGERMLGRQIRPDQLAPLLHACGIDQVPADPEIVWSAIMLQGSVVGLAGGRQLRRATVAGAHRCEIVDAGPLHLDQLKAAGCFTEIIAWKTRVFVPDDARRREILAHVLTLWPAA